MVVGAGLPPPCWPLRAGSQIPKAHFQGSDTETRAQAYNSYKLQCLLVAMHAHV